ncbi:MAG: DUF502 domain-containing protein [Opitutales bacterium]|jgi:uncharacterized membrane protein
MTTEPTANSAASAEPPPLPPSFLRSMRNAFITGLFLLAPLGVSVFVVNFLITSIGDPAGKIFFGWFIGPAPKATTSFAVSVVSTLIVVVLITALGYASHYLLGNWLVRQAENIMLRVPFIGLVYRTTKQIVDTFRHQQKAVFQKVVLIEFPRRGAYAVGFITSTAQGELQQRTAKHVINVFIPTTPNPTSGFLIVCPQDEIIELEMSVGDGMKLIISGGAVVPVHSPRHGLNGPVSLSQPSAASAPAQIPPPAG